MKNNILIVDDEKNTREGLARFLKTKNMNCFLAEDGKMALDVLSANHIDLMLTDLRMPALGGMDLIKRARELYTELRIIVATAYGSVESAVEALKVGADDFLIKPVNLDKLYINIKNILNIEELKEENIQLKRQLEDKFGLKNIIGSSEPMRKVFEIIKQVADTKANVLICGESGTGKELVAKAIHQISGRRNNPFVAVHCASLSENLLESELFGHEKGSFTGATEQRIGRFEQANNGTFFLDEVSEIPQSIQVKLLRVLQEQTFERVGGNKSIKVDIRIISASNKNLENEVMGNRFREDLFYRLSVVNINIPPLRERIDDIPLLINHYLDYFVKENGKHPMSFDKKSLSILKDYKWPGNIRELRNLIENIVVLSRGPLITANDLPSKVLENHKHHIPLKSEPLNSDLNLGVNLKENEKTLIIKALSKSAGNRTKAADMLGFSRRTLYRKLQSYGIE